MTQQNSTKNGHINGNKSGRTLAHLRIGEKARILRITGKAYQAADNVLDGPLAQEELEHRLLEAGFMEGEEIEVIHHGPIGRDPIAVQVADMIVALRRNEANAVLVE